MFRRGNHSVTREGTLGHCQLSGELAAFIRQRFIDAATDGETVAHADKINIVVPKAGCVVKSSLGCTITVAPAAAFTVSGTYTDSTGKLVVNVTNLPVSITGSGCPPATTSSFVSTFTTTLRLHDN